MPTCLVIELEEKQQKDKKVNKPSSAALQKILVGFART